MQDAIDRGRLYVSVQNTRNFPVEGATVQISSTGNPSQILESLSTDAQGQTETLQLPAPPIEWSLDRENLNQPYSEYNARIEAPGYEPVVISGIEILSTMLSNQQITLRPLTEQNTGEDFVIEAHTLYGDYPPKIPESEIKTVEETGEIVLSRVVIPEIVVVHDGAPTDTTATNYYVQYRDYIKNVACSEIYATWPRNTIIANILAIMSFTLNRVYTEWYRNKGYDFTITSSTAYDHKWIHNRNIFDDISLIVDDIFNQFLSRPNVRQPILTQYCDGRRVSCPNWMTQWGSKELGDRGYTPIEILRYYYGDDMYINSTEQISGIPSSWPGYNLTNGVSGQKVMQLQEQLNTIGDVYSRIPQIQEDGIYGPATAQAVRAFQSVFGLPQTGIVDFRTWYKISQIYVGVTRIAELS